MAICLAIFDDSNSGDIAGDRFAGSFGEFSWEKAVFQVPGSMVNNSESGNARVVSMVIADLWEWAYMLLLKHNFAEDGLQLLPGGV